MTILVKILKIDDVILTILGNVLFSAGCVIRGLIENIFGFYLSAFFIGMIAIIPIGTRSKLSKTVSEHESSKVFSLLSTCETIAPVLGSFLYAAIFSLSIDSYFGLTYHFSAVFFVIGIASLLLVNCWRDKQVYCNESITFLYHKHSTFLNLNSYHLISIRNNVIFRLKVIFYTKNN